MRSVLTIILIGLSLVLNAQKNKDYSKIDFVALLIPDSLTQSTKGIAGYINSNFSNESDKARAAFIWVTINIQYDVDNMFAINFYANKNEVIDKVLKTRKGICQHYAELYNNIINQVGIKSYVIYGYTKQNEMVNYIPHAWCAGLIDSTWFLFDPTWGSGYVHNSRFVRKINNFYFKTKPENLIKSHMPFDPLWQFLNYPVTNQEFYEGNFKVNKNKPFFNFIDTLSKFEQESNTERLISSSNRIERNGVKNSLIFDKLQENKLEIEYYKNKLVIETHNAAVSFYNDGINELNKFVQYRNKQFIPKKADNEIKNMLDTAEYSLNLSREKLNEIRNPDSNMTLSISQLNRSIEDAMKNLNDQKVFLDKYVKTNKKYRNELFYVKQ